MGQIVFTYVDYGCQGIQSQVFFEMIVDVAPYHGAFFAGFAGGRDKGYGEFAAPHEKEKDYFQDILADDVIARQVDFNLPDQAFQVEQKLLFVGLVMDDGVADAAVVPGQGFQAVYAHDNIFQRVFFRTDLCVLNVGIYSNYVPGIDRVGVVHQFQVSPAPVIKNTSAQGCVWRMERHSLL